MCRFVDCSLLIRPLEDVKKEFERHGTVKGCRLVRDIGTMVW